MANLSASAAGMDRWALRALYQQYGARTYFLCRCLYGDGADARFPVLLEGAWCALGEKKRRRGAKPVFAAELGRQLLENWPESAPAPDPAKANEAVPLVMRALLSLSRETAASVILRGFYSLSPAQLCALTGLSEEGLGVSRDEAVNVLRALIPRIPGLPLRAAVMVTVNCLDTDLAEYADRQAVPPEADAAVTQWIRRHGYGFFFSTRFCLILVGLTALFLLVDLARHFGLF